MSNIKEKLYSAAEGFLSKTSKVLDKAQKKVGGKDTDLKTGPTTNDKKKDFIGVKALYCPNCNAPISIEPGEGKTRCEYCATEFFVEQNDFFALNNITEKASDNETPLDYIAPNVETALNDVNDEEVQRLKEKYPIKTLNPFKNKKNKEQLYYEVEELLNLRRANKRRAILKQNREKRKEKTQLLIQKIKLHFKVNYRKYALAAAAVLLVGISIPAVHSFQTNVRNIQFIVSDEEVNVGDAINVDIKITPETAEYHSSDISFIVSDSNAVQYNKTLGKYITTNEGQITIKVAYKGREYGSKSVTINTVPVKSISLKDFNIGRGNSISIKPQIIPQNATNKNFTLSVDDENIVRINGNSITGVSLGETILHIISFEGANCDVSVNVIEIEPQSITVSGLNSRYILGDTAYATVKYSPVETTLRDIKWTSSNRNVLDIDESGHITALGKGSAVITAYYNDDIKSEKEITVGYPDCTINGLKNIFISGESSAAKAVFNPSDRALKNITWKSSDENVINVDAEGNVVALNKGVAKIAVYYNGDILSEKEISVEYPLPSEISISSPSDKVYVGDTLNLSVLFTPSKVSDDTITWSSDSTYIAEINSEGILTANNSGSVSISAETSNGKTATINIKVEVPPREITPVYSTYILNTQTKVFHNSRCSYLPTKNRAEMYTTREYLISNDYTPCGHCHP